MTTNSDIRELRAGIASDLDLVRRFEQRDGETELSYLLGSFLNAQLGVVDLYLELHKDQQ